MSTIILKLEHRKAIAKHGETAYPSECRGLLLGHRNGLSKHVVDIVFDDESSQPESLGSRFAFTSDEMADAEAIASGKQLEVLGSFHSLADAPARPDADDRACARPKLSYVMVGVREGRAHELTAWTLSEDRCAFFQEEMRNSH
jgi:proteasome lid subunit RPN8/RPN11